MRTRKVVFIVTFALLAALTLVVVGGAAWLLLREPPARVDAPAVASAAPAPAVALPTPAAAVGSADSSPAPTPVPAPTPKISTRPDPKPKPPTDETESQAEPSVGSTPPATLEAKPTLTLKINHFDHLAPRVRLYAGDALVSEKSPVILESGQTYAVEVTADGLPTCAADLTATQGADGRWTLQVGASTLAVTEGEMLRCAGNGSFKLTP